MGLANTPQAFLGRMLEAILKPTGSCRQQNCGIIKLVDDSLLRTPDFESCIPILDIDLKAFIAEKIG